MKEWAKDFYRSSAWKHARAAAVKRAFGLCERCGEEGYIVHHKTYLTKQNINNPAIALDPDNLEFLCQRCHNAEHGYFTAVPDQDREVVFDSAGNITAVKDKEDIGALFDRR